MSNQVVKGMKKYCLTSTELRNPYAARQCVLIRRVSNEVRGDLAMVTVSPPLERWIYNTAEDISTLILAARFEGESLFVEGWQSLAVYICSYTESPNARINILDYGLLTVEE